MFHVKQERYYMEKYEYILIDLDDTIFDFKKGERASLIKVMKDMGYSLSEKEILLFSKINEKYFQKYANGEISRDDFHNKRFNEFFNLLNINYDFHLADAKYMEELSMATIYVDGAYDFLMKLHKKYKLFIASNGMYEIQVSRLKKANIFDLFEKIYVSSKIGANKPDSKFYEYIFNDLNDYDKSKYLMIGDRESSDIIGGINSGIDTMYFNRLNNVVKTKPTYVINSLDSFNINMLEK